MTSSKLISRLSFALFALTALGAAACTDEVTEATEATEAAAAQPATEARVAGEPSTAALTWYQLGRDNCYDVWGMACNGTHPAGARCSSAVAGQPCSTPISSCYKVATPWFTEFECR